MTGARPWYKRYPADFIAATLHLSLEEKGAFSIVLDLIYDRGEPIPDDSRWIARVCGCSTRKWNVIRQALIEDDKIAETGDGRLTNKRSEKERGNAAKTSRARAENALNSPDKTPENEPIYSKNNNLAPERLEQKPAYARGNQKLEARKNSVANATGADCAEKPPPVDPAKLMFDQALSLLTGAGVAEKGARSLVGRWRKQYGTGAVIEALGVAVREGVSDPAAFITKTLETRNEPRGRKPGFSGTGDDELRAAAFAAVAGKIPHTVDGDDAPPADSEGGCGGAGGRSAGGTGTGGAGGGGGDAVRGIEAVQPAREFRGRDENARGRAGTPAGGFVGGGVQAPPDDVQVVSEAKRAARACGGRPGPAAHGAVEDRGNDGGDVTDDDVFEIPAFLDVRERVA